MLAPRPGYRRLLGCLFAGLLLAGCAEKTEQEQLAELRNGLTYKQYRQLSERGMPAAYTVWAVSSKWADTGLIPPFSPDTECLAHVLVGYSALTADRGTLAIAEADIVSALPACAYLAQASAALRSVAFQRLGWSQLAREENELATYGGAKSDSPDVQQAVVQALVIHVVLGYAALADSNPDRAQIHIDAIALVLEQPWIGELGTAGLAIQQGDVRQGLVAIKRLSDNPAVPPEVRQLLQEAIGQIESRTGSVDSSLWTTRVLAMVIWRELRVHGPENLRWLVGFVDQYKGGLGQISEGGKSWLTQWWDAARARLSSRTDGAGD